MQQYCRITHNEDECFVDFSFDIINIKKKLMGGIFLECAACDDGKNVGFCLEIKNNMRGIAEVRKTVSIPAVMPAGLFLHILKPYDKINQTDKS